LNDVPDQSVGNPMVFMPQNVADTHDLRPGDLGWRCWSSGGMRRAASDTISTPRCMPCRRSQSPSKSPSVLPRTACSTPSIASRMANSAGRTSRSVKTRARPTPRFDPEAGGPGCPGCLESVRRVYAGLHSFLNISLMEARRRKASALRLRFSQSFASLRHRPSQAKVRSTTHRLGRTTKALA
jgi:hypothetical protein